MIERDSQHFHIIEGFEISRYKNLRSPFRSTTQILSIHLLVGHKTKSK